MTFNFEIAIPSYKRPDILREKTLKWLMEQGVYSHQILIFLRDKEEQKIYEESIGKAFRFHITGQTGIDSTRNYLREYYQESELDGVLFMDDDIENINDMGNTIHQPFLNLVEDFFIETLKRKLRLFSINLCNNPFYMKDQITTTLRYCCGGFQGLIIDKSKPTIFCDVGHFEDFQFTMEHFLQDGGVVRFDRYGITTKNYEKKGGICENLGGLEARQKEAEVNAKYLVERYEGMCRIKMKKIGYDLRLNHCYKNILSEEDI